MAGDAIYLVLDMENDIIHEDGPNGEKGYGPQARSRNIVSNTARALEKARAAGVQVGYVRVGFSPDYRECPPDSPIFRKAPVAGVFKLGTWGTEVHPGIKPQDGDFDIVKHRVSPFYGTSLEPVLRANGIKTIYVSGVSTNAVVQSAVREGHDRDYRMVIIEDGCCALTDEEHRNSIEGMRRFARVVTSDELDFEEEAAR
jgi:nicotinamidase-related amidase